MARLRPYSPYSPYSQGFSLLELLCTVALIGLASAIAVPSLNRNILQLSSAVQNLVGDLRTARASATSRGARYRITLSSDSYVVQRLQDTDGDGAWEPAPGFPTRTVALPQGIALSVESGDGVVEFSPRGLVVPRPDDFLHEIEEIRLSDTRHGRMEWIAVWPSGQVQEL